MDPMFPFIVAIAAGKGDKQKKAEVTEALVLASSSIPPAPRALLTNGAS